MWVDFKVQKGMDFSLFKRYYGLWSQFKIKLRFKIKMP